MDNKLSGFQQVKIFHEVFGHPVCTSLQEDIFLTNPKLVDFRISLIEEEKNELKEACDQKNLIEVSDAIGDTLFVTYGMCLVLGINYDEYQLTLDNIPKLYCSENSNPNIDAFDKNQKELESDLISLENFVTDLKNSCENANMKKVKENINSIVCQCYVISSLFRINIVECFSEIFRSNMTKVCSTEEEAKNTVDWYKQNDKRYIDPSYRKSSDDKYWIVFDNSTTKILKSIKFELPNLKKVIFQEV